MAREWIDRLLADGSLPQPKGVFWWGFYEKRNVDEFFDAALAYLTGGGIDVKEIPSANRKARMIGAMLSAGRYLFVLDGLEVMQYEDGDMYGSIRSPDLKAFLEFFASPDHESFCLVTSRAPLVDMIKFATYKYLDVDRLSPQDGRDLLRKLGVKGRDEELDKVVKDWDGHALTLSLLASYLKDHYDGDIAQVQNIPPPTTEEPRYERVHRVLRQYDEHLDEAAKAFLRLFSAFRTPVDRDALDKVFRVERKGLALSASIAALDDSEFPSMVEKLVAYRILRYEPKTGKYTAHPLIRAHYFDLLAKGDRGQAEEAHQYIKEYYLTKVLCMADRPTLEDLMPVIEAIHHACQCGDYHEAENIRWEYIDRHNEHYILHKLGASETDLEILKEFFPNGDTTRDPLVNATNDKALILNEVGFCLINIGQGLLAEEFYKRGLDIDLVSENWLEASGKYQSLSYLFSLSGKLVDSLQAAGKALNLARMSKNANYECASMAHHAWACHLQGDLEKASQEFLEAEALQKKLGSSELYLYSLRGIQHADHLRRRVETDYASRVTEANLEICGRAHWPDSASRCHRVAGDISADSGQEEEARKSYGQALDIARSISNQPVLIEVLLARGRWYASNLKDDEAALSELAEALEYARAGGYRLYEADIRIGLAWAHFVAGNDDRARDEAGYALQMSQEMGYHWGIVDAKELLAKLGEK